MLEKIVDVIWEPTKYIHIPLMNCYEESKDCVFLNTEDVTDHGKLSTKDKIGKAFADAGNFCLSPVRYLMNGKKVTEIKAHECSEDATPGVKMEHSFDYSKDSVPKEFFKVALAIMALPFSLIVGSVLKGIGYISPLVRDTHASIKHAMQCQCVDLDDEAHNKLHDTLRNLNINEIFSDEVAVPTVNKALPRLEPTLKKMMEAVHDISKVLSEKEIPHFLTCGSLIGSYRDGSALPWDSDCDMGIMKMDHENVMRALRGLDPEKYVVQDWSCSRNPNSFIRVYMKETMTYIDIDEFKMDVDEETGEPAMRFDFSWIDAPWQPQYAKDREIAHTRFAIPLQDVFPLKQGPFGRQDEFGEDKYVPVPNNWEVFLKRCYHGNLPTWQEADISPCKEWNPATKQYERIPDHPYWQQSAV